MRYSFEGGNPVFANGVSLPTSRERGCHEGLIAGMTRGDSRPIPPSREGKDAIRNSTLSGCFVSLHLSDFVTDSSVFHPQHQDQRIPKIGQSQDAGLTGFQEQGILQKNRS